MMPSLKRVISFLKPYWKRVVLSAICMAMFALLSGALIWMIGPLLKTLFLGEADTEVAMLDTPDALAAGADAGDGLVKEINDFIHGIKGAMQSGVNSLIEGETPLLTLRNLCVVILIIALTKSLFFYFQGYLMAFVEQRFIKDIRDRIFMQFQKLSLSYFHSAKVGDLLSRVTNDVMVLRESLDQAFNRVIREPLLIAIYIGFMIVLSWKLTIITFVVLPIAFFIIYQIGKVLRLVSSRAQARMADVNSVLEENVSNMRVVKAFGAAAYEIDKFTTMTTHYFRELLKISRMRLLSSPANEFLGTFAGVIILWYGGKQVLGESLLTPEDFLLYVIAMFSIIAPAKSLSNVHVKVQEGLAAADRIFEILDTKIVVTNRPNARPIERFEREIVYDSVSFSYDGSAEVLSEISFDVHPGEVVAVVGPSGAGKSTLLDLLPRFYDPTGGKITIDGIDLRDIEIGSLRSLFGVVTQETMLFNDTIAANIAYGLKEYDIDEVVEAAKVANAHRFIMSFKRGYDTPIGNRGVMLSGGQRQRLAIARAVLRSPQILIFDEATSALDTESEQLVQEAIDRLMIGRTVLVIAHRLSTIMHANKILVLENGRMVEEGTHEELLAKHGMYRKLYDMQFKVNGHGVGFKDQNRQIS